MDFSQAQSLQSLQKYMGDQALPRPVTLESQPTQLTSKDQTNSQNWFSSLIAGPRAELTGPSKEQSREGSPNMTPTHQVRSQTSSCKMSCVTYFDTIYSQNSLQIVMKIAFLFDS